MSGHRQAHTSPTVALRKESVDRNKVTEAKFFCIGQSLSARRAWIEILILFVKFVCFAVALRKESVDRNSSGLSRADTVSVALRKESVDRNCRYPARCVGLLVALRKESVDRNVRLPASLILPLSSLSARRAWIEIPAGCWRDARRAVALRKESVDRNLSYLSMAAVGQASLSARRAWIEIERPTTKTPDQYRRSPQGERG